MDAHAPSAKACPWSISAKLTRRFSLTAGRVDPGPRGVRLENYKQLEANGGVARAGWKFDKSNWWLEEHGLIMEAPDFPLPAGRYMVTGGRETTAVLTVNKDASWELSNGAKLYDVTHLPCRSAKYTPSGGADGSPASARPRDFPVTPGAASTRSPCRICALDTRVCVLLFSRACHCRARAVPAVEGTNKQDYSVIFVTAIEQ